MQSKNCFIVLYSCKFIEKKSVKLNITKEVTLKIYTYFQSVPWCKPMPVLRKTTFLVAE